MLPHVRRRDPTHAKTRTKTVVGRANAMLMSAVGLRVLQASGLKPAQRAVLAEFEEKGQRQPKLEDGVMIEEAITKYWVKWDGEATATTTTAPRGHDKLTCSLFPLPLVRSNSSTSK